VSTASQIKQALHAHFHKGGEWVFLEELRNGTGFKAGSDGYMDGFAINCFPSKGFERLAFEIKVSRSDFQRELKAPLKRKVALLYSNRFFFVAPAGLLRIEEIPPEAGLLEHWPPNESNRLQGPNGAMYFGSHLWAVVPAPWRDTPPPSWSLFASMARKIKRANSEAA
jgi:hypothetical protein